MKLSSQLVASRNFFSPFHDTCFFCLRLSFILRSIPDSRRPRILSGRSLAVSVAMQTESTSPMIFTSTENRRFI